MPGNTPKGVFLSPWTPPDNVTNVSNVRFCMLEGRPTPTLLNTIIHPRSLSRPSPGLNPKAGRSYSLLTQRETIVRFLVSTLGNSEREPLKPLLIGRSGYLRKQNRARLCLRAILGVGTRPRTPCHEV
jgi:hypothetical protein